MRRTIVLNNMGRFLLLEENALEKLLEKISQKLKKDKFDHQTAEDMLNICRETMKTDKPIALRYALGLAEHCEGIVPLLAKTDLENARKFLELHKNTLHLCAKDDFDSYLQFLEWNRDPENRFYLPRREILRVLVQDLQDLADRRIVFLGISCPPRVGKSTLCIMFLSWMMGRNPLKANLMTGYSDTITESFYKEVLLIVSDPTVYNFGLVFPESPIVRTSAKNENIELLAKSRFPTFTARSITGSMTGSVEVGEGGVFYSDDLVEGVEEALSPARLEKKYELYLNQAKDRRKDGSLELMVGTRWNVLDPLGRVAEQYRDNPMYRFRVIPALDEMDESNFKYKFGVGFSTAYYLDMRASIDEATWWAKYMGKPYVREGLLYDGNSLRRFYELPDSEPDAILSICDTKDRGTDYAFLPVVYQYGQDFYVEDCVVDKGLPEIVEPRLVSMLCEHKVHLCRFESNSAGGRIADKIQEGVKERGGRTHITKRYTTANKETKIIVNAPWVKSRCLFKNESEYAKGGDYARMMMFLTTYTMDGKNPNDDVPDGLAMLAEYAQSLTGSKVEAFERPF